MRPKQRVTLTAERALKAAIAEETAGVREELAAANRVIVELSGLLGKVAQIASQGGQAVGVVDAHARSVPVPARIPVAEEVEIPSGPETELAGDDNLGAGRWV